MQYLTDEILRTRIGDMDLEFDSHCFIFEIMRKNPQEYTLQLYKYRADPDPIRQLSSQIARRLNTFENIEQVGEDTSINHRNFLTPNKKWKNNIGEEN